MPTRPTRKPAARRVPFVVLDVDLKGEAFELVLTNIGRTPAYAVETTFSTSIQGHDPLVDLAELPVFKHLGLLRPDKEIRVFVDRAAAVLSRKSTAFSAKVSYRDDQGATHQKAYDHDFAAYAGIPRLASD